MPASDQKRQRIARAFAVAAALLHLVEPFVSYGSLSPWLGTDWPTLVWVTSALLIATSVLVPAVGGWLTLRAPDVALAVLGVTAAASLPAAVWVLRDTFAGTASLVHLVNIAGAGLLVVSVVLLLSARDPGRWRWDRPASARYFAVAVVAVVCSHQVLELPLGHLAGLRALGAEFVLLSLVGPFVLAAAALFAARLPRQLGGAMLLAAFGPAVAAALMHASSALIVVDVGQRVEPFGLLKWAGVAAQVCVIAFAVRWVTSPDVRGNRPSLAAHAGNGAVAG